MSTKTKRTRRTRSSQRRRNSVGSDGMAVKRAVMNGAGRIKLAVADATGEVLDSLQDVRAHATEQARENLESLRDTAAGYIQQGRSQAREAEGLVEQKIRLQPLTSVVLAAGVGFVMGALWRRR